MEAQTHSATSLLARLLGGIRDTALLDGEVAGETPTFSLDELEETAAGEVSTKLILPSGDVYRVTVAWISEESS